jgi:tetratricopeptide (TPR) repeat protein
MRTAGVDGQVVTGLVGRVISSALFVCDFRGLMRILVLWVGITASIAAFAPTVRAQTGRDAEARALFEAGQVAFGDGRYENALDYFRRSYDLSHRPELLYNIGTTSDRLRLDRDALAAFEQYLTELPQADNRGEVEARIVVLRRAVAAAVPAETVETDAADTSPRMPPRDEVIGREPLPPPPVPPRSPSVVPWVIVGIGAAAAIAGAVLVGVAAADVSSVENAARGTAWTSVRDAYGQSEALSIAGFVLLGVGAAAIAAGLGWGIVEIGEGDQTARVSLGPGSLSIAGTF